MPSTAEVSKFQELLTTLSAKAIIAVTALWNQYAGSDDTTRWKALQDAYPDLVTPFLGAAAVLSEEWYSSLDTASLYPVQAATPTSADTLAANVTWAMTQADIVGALTGSTQRQVFTTSRSTIVANARREKVKFARYASANACSWCRVLATREAVYSTAENAIKGHDLCHCIAVPVRGDNIYTPPDYVKQWTQDYNDARDAVGGNLNDIVNHMRRNQ